MVLWNCDLFSSLAWTRGALGNKGNWPMLVKASFFKMNFVLQWIRWWCSMLLNEKKYLSFNEFESWSKLLFSKWILSVNESEWWSRLRFKECCIRVLFFQPPVFLILRLYLVLDSALLKLSRFQWNKTSDLTALSLPCTVLEKSSF